MSIIQITNDNIIYLHNFLDNDIPNTFRYFCTRNIDVIKNHIITIIYRIDNKSVGYGHIDYDINNHNYWLGCCILSEHQSKGIGTQIIKYLINYFDKLNLNLLKLSVDKSNSIAINLYTKYGFKINNSENNSNNIYIMEYNTNNTSNMLMLPVSYGEGFDKLTILDIKKQYIKGDKLNDVITEYNELYSKLSTYINSYIFYYKLLKEINHKIWVKQDIFRDSSDDYEKNILCKDIILLNDSRFRIKNKINYILQSHIKEQKAYTPKKAIILTHLGLGDNITSIPAVRYYSLLFDEIYVIAKTHNGNNVKLFYKDDPTITVISIINDAEFYYSEYIKELLKDSTLISCGGHINPHLPFTYLPFNFYDDMKLPYSVFWEYNYIPSSNESKELYNLIKDKEYIFIHNTSSSGKVFNVESVTDIDNILVINPCNNVYPEGHQYYTIAEQFINKPLPYYIYTIINAQKVIVTDSSFMCLSIQLPIKTDECYYISRGNVSYEHIWDSKYGYNTDYPYKKFNKLSLQ